MLKRYMLLWCVLAMFALPGYAMESDEIRSTLQEQQDVAVTIYNDNLALVKDQRRVKLKSGFNNLFTHDKID